MAGLQSGSDAGRDVAKSASGLWDSTLNALPRVGIAAGIIAIGWALGHGLRWFLYRRLSRRRTQSFATVMSKVVSWVLLGAVILLAIAVTFPSVRPVDLLAGLGFFSVALGFAFQDILENTLSGILLLFRQPFRSGDQITVTDQSGTVEGITIRETRLTTYDGELIVIPNRDVYKNVINIHTHHDHHRLEFVVGITYRSDAEEAIGIILDVLAPLAEVRADPAPTALVSALSESTVDIAVRFWTDSTQAESLTAADAAIRAVKRGLDRAGIDMPASIVVLQADPTFERALRGSTVRSDSA